MKCTELRQELAKRGAESKGVKAVLVARLQELDAVAGAAQQGQNETQVGGRGGMRVLVVSGACGEGSLRRMRHRLSRGICSRGYGYAALHNSIPATYEAVF